MLLFVVNEPPCVGMKLKLTQKTLSWRTCGIFPEAPAGNYILWCLSLRRSSRQQSWDKVRPPIRRLPSPHLLHPFHLWPAPWGVVHLSSGVKPFEERSSESVFELDAMEQCARCGHFLVLCCVCAIWCVVCCKECDGRRGEIVAGNAIIS